MCISVFIIDILLLYIIFFVHYVSVASLVRPRIYYIIMYTILSSLKLFVHNLLYVTYYYYKNITEPQGNLILFNKQKNSHVSKNEEFYHYIYL